MIALLDAGNSSIKRYLMDDGKTIVHDQIPTTEWENEMKQWLTRYPIKVIAASTVSVDLSPLKTLGAVRYFEVNSGIKLPFENLYETPETLGADRIAGIAGALALVQGTPVLKIDAGTCLTFDLSDGKHYLGGRISPGVHMRLKAMHQFTARLPQPGFDGETGGLTARNTNDSLRHGALLGAVNEIEGYVQHIKRAFPLLQVVLTGGDGPVLFKHLEKSIFVPGIELREHLVAEGIFALLAYNAPSSH